MHFLATWLHKNNKTLWNTDLSGSHSAPFPYWMPSSKFWLGPNLPHIYLKISFKAISFLGFVRCLHRRPFHLILRIFCQICSTQAYYSTHLFYLELKISDSCDRGTKRLRVVMVSKLDYNLRKNHKLWREGSVNQHLPTRFVFDYS